VRLTRYHAPTFSFILFFISEMKKQSRRVFKMSVKKALKDAPLQNALWQLFEDAVIRVNRITNMASMVPVFCQQSVKGDR